MGLSSLILGAGRTKKEDIVDLSVGIYLKKKVGDKVEKGEPLAIFHTDGDEKKFNEAKAKFLKAYIIGSKKVNSPKFLFARVTKDKVEEF